MDKNTIIVAGFPGVGKTYLSTKGRKLNILDLDGKEFIWSDDNCIQRNPNYPNNYIQGIKDNMGKYDIIFIALDFDILKRLDNEKITFIILYPNKSLKKSYITRYRRRGDSVEFIESMKNDWDSVINKIETKKTYLKLKLNTTRTIEDIFLESKVYTVFQNIFEIISTIALIRISFEINNKSVQYLAKHRE